MREKGALPFRHASRGAPRPRDMPGLGEAEAGRRAALAAAAFPGCRGLSRKGDAAVGEPARMDLPAEGAPGPTSGGDEPNTRGGRIPPLSRLSGIS